MTAAGHMSEWWREASWMVVGGVGYVHPSTDVTVLADGSVTLRAHKVQNWAVTVPATHPLAAAADERPAP